MASGNLFARAARWVASRFDSSPAEPAARGDGWNNVLTGLGTSGRDKRLYGDVSSPQALGEQTLSNLYSGDPLARRICDLPANEQTRRWIRFTSDAGAETNKAVHQALQVLGAQAVIRQAISWSRLYGGAVLLLGADDGGKLWQPLRAEGIKSFPWLAVLDRWNLEIAARYDKLGPKFRLPQFYRVIGANAGTDYGDLIHESRVLHFDGLPTTRLQRDINNGWCDSVFVALFDVIRDVWSGFDGAAHLLTDFSQAVIKIKNLAGLMSSGQEATITARLQLLDMVRSVVRATVVDADGEDVERKSTPVSGLADLLDRTVQMLSAVTGIPVTLLMGQAPAGLQATGASDIRFFYDSMSAAQESTLRSPIERLLTLLLRAADGPTGGREPTNWSFTFNPLWQLDDLQEAERRSKQAQTDQVYITNQVLLPEEVRRSRFAGDAYSTETTLDPAVDATAIIEASQEHELEVAAASAPKETGGEGAPDAEDGEDAPDPEDEEDDEPVASGGDGGGERADNAAPVVGLTAKSGWLIRFDEWNENQPRDEDGKWGEGGSGGGGEGNASSTSGGGGTGGGKSPGGKAPKYDWKKDNNGDYHFTADGEQVATMTNVKGPRGGKGDTVLRLKDGREFNLGKRATFGHAEGILVREGVVKPPQGAGKAPRHEE